MSIFNLELEDSTYFNRNILVWIGGVKAKRKE